MLIVVVLLSEAVTDKLIEGGTGRYTHGFAHLCVQASFEAGNLLRVGVHKLWRVTGQSVEQSMVLHH